MPSENELAAMLRGIIKEEMQTVRSELMSEVQIMRTELGQEVRSVVQEELKPVRQELQELRTGQQELRESQQELRAGMQELKQGQASIEVAVNDLRALNRRTHKEVFAQLNAIWDEIKIVQNRLETQEEKNYRRL